MIKQLPKFILALLVLCLTAINLVKAQSVSNEGTEFWSVFPTHVPNQPTQLANISIFITGSQASTGTVSVGSYSQKFTVVANTVTEIQVPRANAYINDFEGGTVLTNRAIHIVVDNGQPAVVVYAHIFAGARSAASLILPVKALGQQYYSMNYQQTPAVVSGGQNFIVLVASEANTKIFIKKGNTDLVSGGITLTNIGDVYEYLSNSDLTGASVTVDSTTSGCKRFAMFSGSSGDAIADPSCSPHSIDPLYQQNYPIESWGKTYGFIPFSMKAPGSNVATERTLGDYVRVVAEADNTNVQINGVTVATLNKGGFYSSPTPLSQPASISADKPISVAQYALTASCSNINGAQTLGDPDMVILNPIEYSIKNITVYSSTREAITEQYINVLIKTASVASFRINGAVPTTAFVPMATLPGYSYLQLNLNGYRTNNFNLTADDGFNAVAYGFGQVESYSYSAGTNLATTVTANAVDPVTNLPITSACVYDNYNLQVTLNVPTQKIVWTITPSNPATVINTLNPVAKDTIINTKPYYIYVIPKPAIFNKAGLYNVNIVADLPPSTGGCTIGDQNFNFPFTVYSAPITAFTMPASVCAGSAVTFADKSTDSSKVIKSWIWKFGDGTTSTLQNPTHTYSKPGIDTVSLTAISESGCQTTTQKYLTVNNLPVAAFTYTNAVFKNFAVFFKDASTIVNGKIVRWAWTFGDGSTATKSNNLTFEHDYTAAGTYQVKLIVTSDLGCQDTISKSVTAKPAYKPDFRSPQVCSADLSAQFFDLTADSVGTNVALTYLWNFGDADATAANPNTSTDKNPAHRFSKAQIYQVTLTVTAGDSSSASITKPFQVNGSMPKAAFNIITPGNVCSNQPITFENQSTVDIGSITKIEWYFDYQNQLGVVVTDVNPVAGKRYIHQYDIFNMPATKTFTVRMVAYSGITCIDITEKTITLNANPKVVFTALGSVCQEVNPFQLTQAEDVSGANGKGVYTGAGVTAGIFNPAAAGIGTHQIKYVFTSSTGCADSLTQNITVNPTPVVDAGKLIRVHIGDIVRLSPKITGKIFSYKWTPATGLSNDHIANPIATPSDDITYRLTVTSTDSCTAVDTVAIRILKIPVIPNTFTPNNDGVNDVWNIQNLDRYPDCIMDIYNRYGVRMFHSIGYGTAWDGRYNGQEVPVGTYYYVLNLKDGTKNYGGYVTVIR
ncbi:PKD domain-containing protein [Mucilaginibacter arboris]|uniref:PKD domain-containing protein n=1 Tax=Mucilaginibacter arboris TaxID=2682090 RepID=A0A7K1SYC5_9SPHI|nr:PKD domain-containing protein [Mucilaginibacter arboris]MVN22321.1 PKD domain-containing protein [Mucilaginibacter arboris]